MKGTRALSVLVLTILAGASLKFTQTAFSSSRNPSRVTSRKLAAAPANPYFATNLNVDRTDDVASASACTGATNDCSLRGAIINANADISATPIIINLQPATTYNLTLANATQENAAATGDLDITTTLHSVTIAGGGASTIINAAGLNTGSNRDRVFQIAGFAATVSFENLLMENGKAADDGSPGETTNPANQTTNGMGGGIFNGGGNVTLTNVIVQNCQALGRGDTVDNAPNATTALGGGIASTLGAVVITGSTFTGNSAQGGNGGNFNNGGGANANGGSIYFEAGTLSIGGSRIENSTATGGNGGNVSVDGDKNGGFGGMAQGGGIYAAGGATTINNTTFENTVANGGNSGNGGNGSEPAGDANGGGIYSLGSVTVTDSTFHLAAAHGGNGGSAVGSGCLGGHFGGDGGAARGGAIMADNFFGGSAALIVDTATFANNAATGGNGGSGGSTSGSCGTHGQGGLAYGGAVTNNNGATIDLKHSTISGNNAQAGNSGVNAGPSRPPRLVAEGTGGGLRVGPGALTIANTIVAGNTAANGLGDPSGAPVPGPDVDGAVTSSGHNLIGNVAEALGFTGPGDLTGVNPSLAALANNGGPTFTMALNPGSPAIDAGVAAGATTDQRGMPRTVDDGGVPNTGGSDGTDIGAFEATVSCTLECQANITQANDPGECTAVVTYTTPGGDSCGAVTCDHPSGSAFPLGETTVQCTSTAGPTCSFTVTVTDTEAPTISCPADITANAVAGTCAANVSFSVGAADNCSSPTVTTDILSGSSFPVGTTTIHATAQDAAGNTSTCSFTVTVKDVTPPAINLNNAVTLWPPNHKYATVNVTDLVASVSDLCDASVNINSVVIASVSSDEPNNSDGDGNTTNDIVIAPGCKSVQLVAERMGGGNGRVYWITFKVTDGSGNTTTAMARVTVPKSQNGNPAVDDGPKYTVNGCP
jgi:hypothetical protein